MLSKFKEVEFGDIKKAIIELDESLLSGARALITCSFFVYGCVCMRMDESAILLHYYHWD